MPYAHSHGPAFSQNLILRYRLIYRNLSRQSQPYGICYGTRVILRTFIVVILQIHIPVHQIRGPVGLPVVRQELFQLVDELRISAGCVFELVVRIRGRLAVESQLGRMLLPVQRVTAHYVRVHLHELLRFVVLRAYRHLIPFPEHHHSYSLPCCRKSPCMERIQGDELYFPVFIVAYYVSDFR